LRSFLLACEASALRELELILDALKAGCFRFFIFTAGTRAARGAF
jgi:hypothetical protein